MEAHAPYDFIHDRGMEDIVKNIGPTADIQSVIKPVYNFKAGEEA